MARTRRWPSAVCRGLGALNRLTGQVTYLQRSHLTVPVLTHFYTQRTQVYHQAEVIYVVLAHLQPQTTPFPLPLPPSWSHLPRPASSPLGLPIQLLRLPAYAPWLNPIEKLWCWVRQAVLPLHRQIDDWDGLKRRVLDFMAAFAHGSDALLRYVGLLPD